tara:strand:- start:131 stop:280 length:150 start_codon:yes stop_codon:yes gene_type:complete
LIDKLVELAIGTKEERTNIGKGSDECENIRKEVGNSDSVAPAIEAAVAV